MEKVQAFALGRYSDCLLSLYIYSGVYPFQFMYIFVAIQQIIPNGKSHVFPKTIAGLIFFKHNPRGLLYAFPV